MKIIKSLYINKKSSDYDEIWYTNADLELSDSHVTYSLSSVRTVAGSTVVSQFSEVGLLLVQRSTKSV